MNHMIITNNGNSIAKKHDTFNLSWLKKRKEETNFTNKSKILQADMDESEKTTLFHSIPASYMFNVEVQEVVDFFIRNYLWAIHFSLEKDGCTLIREDKFFEALKRPFGHFRVGARCPYCLRNVNNDKVDYQFCFNTFCTAYEYFTDLDEEMFMEYDNPDSEYCHISKRYFGATLQFDFNYSCRFCGKQLHYNHLCDVFKKPGHIEPLGLVNTIVTDHEQGRPKWADCVALTLLNNQPLEQVIPWDTGFFPNVLA